MERLKRLLRGDISERTSRILKIISVVVLLFMLFVLAMSRVRGTTMSTVRDSYNNLFSSVGGGGGYPYQVNSSKRPGRQPLPGREPDGVPLRRHDV